MFNNYLKSAWRSFLKNKTFSLINITGMSIGIAVCFIILLYVQSELSFDRFNKNAERIVCVVSKADINGGKISDANVIPPVASDKKVEDG